MCSQIPDHPVSQGFVDEHCCTPVHPLCRSLPKFSADRKQRHRWKDLQQVLEETPWDHAWHIHSVLCPQKVHFSLMADQEGPSIAFQLIYNRLNTGRTLEVFLLLILSHYHILAL
ncbi:TPA: hypothetical protein ACH3X2_006656 [Trebouxia sp. C0005]